MKNKIVKKGDSFVEVQLSVLVFEEHGSFLAFCPALELSTYGDSISDVKEAFEDAITSYLEDCAQSGSLEQDLRAHGWDMQVSTGKVTPPNEMALNIPIPAGMLKQQFNELFRVPVPSC